MCMTMAQRLMGRMVLVVVDLQKLVLSCIDDIYI